MTIKRTKAGHPAARAKRRLRRAAPKVARARSPDAGDITSKPMLIGYARVSTVDQNLALQRDALTEAGCAKIFTEQMSGAVKDRPALHDALEFARSGDALIVWKLDRLARSMKQLIETVETLRSLTDDPTLERVLPGKPSKACSSESTSERRYGRTRTPPRTQSATSAASCAAGVATSIKGQSWKPTT
jgi:hypothetical protein